MNKATGLAGGFHLVPCQHVLEGAVYRQAYRLKSMTNIVKEIVERADFVLVGIGEEFSADAGESVSAHEEKNEQKEEWLLPFLAWERLGRLEDGKIAGAYAALHKLLENKNYFIVTENMDEKIFHSPLDAKRITAPCGNYMYLQCEEDCAGELFLAEETARRVLSSYYARADGGKEAVPPRCLHCGRQLVFNNVNAPVYHEASYLPMWERYRKWLQGTLQKKVCILELGVGFRYPSIIRWPFEKIAFLNQKADFVRIHHKLYQLSEELKEKGVSIPENAVDFLRNTFVQ